jgi:hypothetical protein
VAQGRIGKSARAEIVGVYTQRGFGKLRFVTWNSWDMPALIRLPNIARLPVMNTAYSMTSFGTISENTKGNKASSRCTKASFVICDNLACLSLPAGLGVVIKNGNERASRMRGS